MSPTLQSNLQIQCDPYQNSNNISTEVRRAMLKFICNHRNSKKLKQFWGRRAKPEALHYLTATSTSKLFGQNQNNIRIKKPHIYCWNTGSRGHRGTICNPGFGSPRQENLEFKSSLGCPVIHRETLSEKQTKPQQSRQRTESSEIKPQTGG